MKKLLAASAATLTLLAGCATTPGGGVAPSAQNEPRSTASASVLRGASDAAGATPSPTVDTTLGVRRPTYPAEPLPTLSAEQQDRFGDCLTSTIALGTKGACSTLALEELKTLGFYEGKTDGRVNSAAVNAILRYQRSRHLPTTAAIAEQTWHALASGRPARPADKPAECLMDGVVLCVDQGREVLTYMKDGEAVREVPVRLGGFTSEAKTGKWRNHPTANGLFRVYNKDRNPSSPTYGEGAMPYSLIFDPNMYVHYSSDFAKHGHSRSSHGCVNVADKDAVKWLFENTPINARVYIW